MTLPKVHLLFQQQAVRTPHARAVLSGRSAVTYAELNVRANRICRRLQVAGVRPGDRVGVWGERSPEAIIGMLAILKAGAAYVPLDPNNPDHRLRFILDDSETRTVLAPAGIGDRLAIVLARIQVVEIDAAEDITIDGCDDDDPRDESTTSDLAYVMYTSGSTGTPKGVLVRHRGVVQLVSGSDYCRFGPDEVFLQHSSLAFDASTFEIWGPLLNGGATAILPPGYSTPDELEMAIRRHSVTTLWLTAGLFHIVVDQRVEILRPLRQLVAGGDVLLPGHVQRALAAMPHGVVINGYGPTECTTFACCFRMQPGYAPGRRVPIGKPISGATAYVLDASGRPAPIDTPGPLCIGGGGVALGYLNNPELTDERFVADPFSTDPGARLYRTGDLALQRADGNFEFLGRLDDQVKISGYRIEPGEIEAMLGQFPEIRQAAVIARPIARGEKQLIAFLVPTAPDAIAVNELKLRLRELLPHFMVPAHFVLVDQFPVTANGKTDRAALASRSCCVAPDQQPAEATDLERTLLDIWKCALGVAPGLDANFFDLGGTSLQLIAVHAEIRALTGRSIPVTAVFQHPTVRAMAAWLGGQHEADPTMASATSRAQQQRAAAQRRKQRREIRA